MRKTVAVILAIVLLLGPLPGSSAAAWEAGREDEKARTALTDSIARLLALNSFHMDADLTMNASVRLRASGQGMGLPLSMNVNLNGAMDRQQTPMCLRVEGEAAVSSLVVNEKRKALAFAEQQGEALIAYASLDEGVTWKAIRSENPQVAPDEMLPSVVAFAKDCRAPMTVMLDGRETMMYGLTLDGQALGQVLVALASDAAFSGLLAPEDLAAAAELEDMDAKVYIDAETMLPCKITVDVTALMDTVSGPLVRAVLEQRNAEGMEVDVRVREAVLSCTFSQYDAVAPIDIPAEARSAAGEPVTPPSPAPEPGELQIEDTWIERDPADS